VLPAGEAIRVKASENTVAAATAKDEAKRRDHAKDGTLRYTFVPFSIKTYWRLGVEADTHLKGYANEGACQCTQILPV
jgi:hypothetical protein